MENRQRLDKNKLQYNFYYYTAEGKFLINVKSFLLFGLVTDCSLMIMSAEQLFKDGNYIGLLITAIIFILILFIIRRLNNGQ